MLKNFNKHLFLFLYSILPLSLIIGNAFININIILIDIFFLYECIKYRNFNFVKEKFFLFLVFIWFYLIVNSILNINTTSESYDGLIRSLDFIRFIFLIYATKYFFKKFILIKERILIFWSVILSIILIDIFFERIIGHNIIGIISPSPERISSFFGKELIVGGFVLGFGFIISAFLLIKSEKLFFMKKIYSNLFLILVPISVLVTGERSNFIKSIIAFILLLILINNKFLLFKKRNLFIITFILAFFSILTSKNILNRQSAIFDQYKIINKIESAETINRIVYFDHYLLAWSIFTENKWLGIGTKNFRYICTNEKYKDKYPRGCTTHPHQIYFEILCEQGIIGFFIFLSFFITIFIKNYIIYKNNKNLYHLSSFLFYIVFLIPLIPSGSFFSTFNASIFWINFSLMSYYSENFKDKNNFY